MKEFKDFLTEGVYDKHIFKAFFLAGGPGSGKGWVSERTLKGSGMKVIDTDIGFQNYAKQAGLDLKKMQSFTPAQTKLKDALRARSKSGTKTTGTARAASEFNEKHGVTKKIGEGVSVGLDVVTKKLGGVDARDEASSEGARLPSAPR